MKKLAFAFAMVGTVAASAAMAAVPGAAVKNGNANSNACWGQDRAFYASGAARNDLGWTNLDIKQSFPNDVGAERAAWVAIYCDPHGA